MNADDLETVIDGLFEFLKTKTTSPFIQAGIDVVEHLADAYLPQILAFVQSKLPAK